MEKVHPRIARERKTVQQMIRLYCRDLHNQPGGALCIDCQHLDTYAMARLERCPFQERKSTCAKCTVHCYKPAVREQIRKVMRYAGPKMLLHHPILAILHVFDGFRQPPVLESKSQR
jgi:hypothetical protein